MKIRTQMFVAMATIMIFFTFTIIFMSLNAKNLRFLNKVAQDSYGLSASYSNMEVSIMRFRSEQDILMNNIHRIEDAKNNFNYELEAMNTKINNPLIDNKVRERWKNVINLWKHNNTELDSVIDSMKTLDTKMVKSLFSIHTYSGIMSNTSLILQNDLFKEDYKLFTGINRGLTTASASSDLFITALNDIRNLLSEDVDKTSNWNQFISLIALGICFIIGIFFSIVFSGGISNKINKIKNILYNISEKDLTINPDIKSKDEFRVLGNYLKKLLKVLQEFMESAGESVKKVTDTNNVLSHETMESEDSLNKIHERINDVKNQFEKLDCNIDESSRDITTMDEEILRIVDYINDQSIAVSNSSSAIEEMTASVSQIANLTVKRQDTSKVLLQVVARGGVSVENTYDNIKQAYIELIKIKELVEVIKNVADQTNILSMNAAIESAHAGDAGKGFSVVADEIRSLSEYTSNNVTAINTAIQSISGKIDSSLKASEDSSSVFELINRNVNEFSDAMIEISSSIKELATGGDDVIRATVEVSALNTSVRESAEKIKTQSSVIENAMGSVKAISSEVNSHIIQISERTNAVLKSFNGINNVSKQSSDMILILSQKMNEFKLTKNEVN